MDGYMKTRVVGITLPVDVVEEAMQLGLHLPTICEQAIRNEIKRLMTIKEQIDARF